MGFSEEPTLMFILTHSFNAELISDQTVSCPMNLE